MVRISVCLSADAIAEAGSKRSSSRASMACKADVRLSSLSSSAAVPVHVTPPCVGSSEIPHVGRDIPCITFDDVATTTSAGRLSALPPPTPHRATLSQAPTVTRANSLRSERRSGLSNVAKRHSTASVTTSPSYGCFDGSQHQTRRSAVPPSTCSASSLDVHRWLAS